MSAGNISLPQLASCTHQLRTSKRYIPAHQRCRAQWMPWNPHPLMNKLSKSKIKAMGSHKDDKDSLDRVIGFLQKREGIDKTLKLIRYTSRLIAAVSPPDTERYKRFTAFEKSIGVSRKAYRLGKFLQDWNNLRKSNATGLVAVLELVAYGGEGVYYFIEQLVWLIKAGAVSKESEAQLSAISAWAELLGYAANIWISVIKIKQLKQDIAAAEAALIKLQKDEGVPDTASSSQASQPAPMSDTGQQQQQHNHIAITSLQRKLLALRAAHSLKTLSIVQDVADSMLALNDIRGGKDLVLSHPATLAVSGLISGIISARKNWNS